ncbi:prolipoprotein diacylglyceryl transferase, partial [Bacteroidota bacterium]
MSILDFIIWSPNPEIFPGISWLPVRWYGLLFAIAFIVGQQIYFLIYKKENKPEKDVETLTIYLIVATLIGARLGHVIFYEPFRYLSNPLEILQIWKGGLASHGASIGILLGIYIYSNYFIKITFSEFKITKRKKEGQSFLYVMDRIVIVAALGGAFIRTGNFVNSEIIGKPTYNSSGILFAWDAIERFEYDQIIDEARVEKNNKSGTSDNYNGYKPVDLILTFSEDVDQERMVRQYVEIHVKRILTTYDYAALHIYEEPGEIIKYSISQSPEGAYVANISTLGIPRYPAQLYEAFSSFLLFLLL